MSDRTLLLIAGMHRSGTSLVAQLVHAMGVPFGDHLETYPIASNGTGHWEDTHIWRASEELLQALGEDWSDEARPLPWRWEEWPEARHTQEEFTQFIASRLKAGSAWGVKDPRATRLLPLWKESARAAGVTLRVIAAMRPCPAVASSLARRNGMDEARASGFWRQYNAELFAWAAREHVLFVPYDTLVENTSTVLSAIASHCDLALPSDVLEKARQLVRPELRHAVVRETGAILEPAHPEADVTCYAEMPRQGRTLTIHLRTTLNEIRLLRSLRSLLRQSALDWTLVVIASRQIVPLVESTLAPYAALLTGRLHIRAPEAGQELRATEGCDIIIEEGDELDPDFLMRLSQSGQAAASASKMASGTTSDWCAATGVSAAPRSIRIMPVADAISVGEWSWPGRDLVVRPGRDIVRAGSFWQTTGADPQLLLAGDEDGAELTHGPGLYLLQLEACSLGSGQPMRLYARSQSEFSESQSAAMHVQNGRRLSVLLDATDGVAGLRLDPAEGTPAAIRLSHVSLRQLGPPLPRSRASGGQARLPDVLCIGAQKAATTWLHANLTQVPGIWPCPVKEFHHFDMLARQDPALVAAKASTASGLLAHGNDAWRWTAVHHGFPQQRGWQAYLDLFRDAPEDQLILDFTPAYSTLGADEVQEITRVMPWIKVILVLRDPVNRAIAGAFHEARVRGISPSAATIAELAHAPANTSRSDYARIISTWRSHLRPGNLELMFYDDLLWDPATFLQQACAFIGKTAPQDKAPSGPVGRAADSLQERHLPSLKAELSLRYLPMLRSLAQELGGHSLQWLAAAEARVRSSLLAASGAGAGQTGTAQHSIENNLAQWNDNHSWSSGGDEWAGQAEHCKMDYTRWKQSIMDRYASCFPSGGILLEIGPGHGRWSDWLAGRASKLVLVDLSPNCLDACQTALSGKVGLRSYLSDGETLPCDLTSTVDGVWSFDCFVHMNERTIRSYIQEIARVLKPGAQAVIHHGDSAAGDTADRGGWRSDITASFIAATAAANGLEVQAQDRRFHDGGGVPRFGDVITKMIKPLTGSR